MFHIFHFLQSDIGVGIVSPFSWKASAISSEKSGLISMPFLLSYTDIRAVKFFFRLLNPVGKFSRYTLRDIAN